MAHESKNQDRRIALLVRGLTLVCLASILLISSCTQIEQPKVEPFYAEAVPPPKPELRWSNGKLPKSFDPARAASAPETDIVRAIYDGLTDLDSKTLRAVPAVAEKWESSENNKVWTFTLRKEARWSNGERVKASDFVASWKRLVDLREKTANRFLFQNIVGMSDRVETKGEPSGEPGDFLHTVPLGSAPETAPAAPASGLSPQAQIAPKGPVTSSKPSEPGEEQHAKAAAPQPPKFGVEAINDSTLKVTLELPDPDLPKLVANPIFRPVYDGGSNIENGLNADIVTNGAFEVSKIDADGITVESSAKYWNLNSMSLESVRFVATASPENALDAYRTGNVDVVTNASFEPLALKLLTPYEDFRRTAHSALNFYEFNTTHAPFADRRVREALAIAIDRAKVTEGDLEGTMQPANAFNLVGESKHEVLSLDVDKAKLLLEKAGFPNGVGFPTIRLVINRNDTQQRVARSVARMWQQNLNIDTQIIIKEPSEIEAVRTAGEFDLLRRGMVLPANDELVSLATIFGSAKKPTLIQPELLPVEPKEQLRIQGPSVPDEATENENPIEKTDDKSLTITEADAIFDVRAIPLYFPTSYALVKPYVLGFEMNGLDAPSLKEISIDSTWKPKAPRTEQ